MIDGVGAVSGLSKLVQGPAEGAVLLHAAEQGRGLAEAAAGEGQLPPAPREALQSPVEAPQFGLKGLHLVNPVLKPLQEVYRVVVKF